jgi:flagellar biosynthetic protein FliQ
VALRNILVRRFAPRPRATQKRIFLALAHATETGVGRRKRKLLTPSSQRLLSYSRGAKLTSPRGATLGADRALYYLNELVWSALIIAGPIMAATLIVGLVVSVLQVATQIQEITLSYVPKLLAAAVVLLLLGGWMLGRLTQFAVTLYQSIPSLSQ